MRDRLCVEMQAALIADETFVILGERGFTGGAAPVEEGVEQVDTKRDSHEPEVGDTEGGLIAEGAVVDGEKNEGRKPEGQGPEDFVLVALGAWGLRAQLWAPRSG